MLKGIDISNWQAGIDLEDITREIDFCIVKATEGLGYVDPYCNSFIDQCRQNSLLWGFYHFARENDPEKEAEFFYENCRNYFGKGIPVLDYETSNNDDVDWCERFLERLHDLSGVWGMLYVSAYRVPYYRNSWIPEKCGLWLAGYPYAATSFDDEDCPYSIDPWQVLAIWQFTSSLDLGIGYRLDANYAYMDADAWYKYAGSSEPQPKPEPEPEPQKSVIELCKEVMSGEWGNGAERRERLTAAGYDYNDVQDTIDEYYQLANEIWRGLWGNGWNRKQALEGAGYDYELAQMIVDEME